MSNLKICSDRPAKGFRGDISMSKKIIFSLSVLFFVTGVFSSCGPSAEEMRYREDSKMLAEKLEAYVPGITTDTINGITHNFVRNADMKLKVTHVVEASNQIEDLITKRGGYITLSDLTSQIGYSSSVKFKADSTAELTHYTVVNKLTLRIPNKQLDTVLRAISGLATFIDYRKLKADDVKMSLYANSLAERRYEKFQSRVEKKSVKSEASTKQNIKTEEALLEKQTLLDNTQLDSYDLADKVNYATLSVELYQPEQIKTLVTFIPPVIETYAPSFATQLKEATLKGFEVLKSGLIFFLSCWGVMVLCLLLVYTIKKVKPFFKKQISS